MNIALYFVAFLKTLSLSHSLRILLHFSCLLFCWSSAFLLPRLSLLCFFWVSLTLLSSCALCLSMHSFFLLFYFHPELFVYPCILYFFYSDLLLLYFHPELFVYPCILYFFYSDLLLLYFHPEL